MKIGLRLMGCFIATLIVASHGARAAESRVEEISPGEELELSDDDLESITLQVLARYPLLASSPGIRFAHAQRAGPSTDLADIIYHPHAESWGVKKAFEVQCRRETKDTHWTCPSIGIRGYLRLESQEFEVRVLDGIGRETALALIEATRGTARASVVVGAPAPESATMIQFHEDGYRVTWGDREGHSLVWVIAHIEKNGDPTDANDWQTELFEPEI